MFKLALNAGHGLNTAGKRCMKAIDPNETREWVLNSRICSKIEALLAGYDGIEVRRMDDTTGNTDRSITQRANAANSFGADFYLAIHHNAGINGGSGGGIEAYTYLKVNQTTKDWQTSLYNALIAHTGLKGNRAQPIKAANLGECRQTKMPAVLLECGYMDSVADVPVILSEDFADKVADACVEVIVAKAGLTAKLPPSPAPAIVAKSKDDIAREVMAGKWGNGEARRKALEAAGYDYLEIQKIVNALVAGKLPLKKSAEEIAKEVIAGKWGDGQARRNKLSAAGYDPSEVQAIVNRMMKRK